MSEKAMYRGRDCEEEKDKCRGRDCEEKGKCRGRDFEEEIARYIGETVTIFTTSGGESGIGFTGVVLSVNKNFVRLITRIGTGPGCPLGSACNDHEDHNNRGYDNDRGCDNHNRGFRVGSVTDIPINRITAFVHNAI